MRESISRMRRRENNSYCRHKFTLCTSIKKFFRFKFRVSFLL